MATAEFVALLVTVDGENLLLLRMGFEDVNTDLENKQHANVKFDYKKVPI